MRNSPATSREEVESAILSRFQFASGIKISRSVVDNMKLSVQFDAAIDQWILEIESFVWGENLQTEPIRVDIHTPKTWWQFFKATHFPRFLLKMFPIEYKVITQHFPVSQVATFPALVAIANEEGDDLDYGVHLKIEPTGNKSPRGVTKH